MKTKPFKGDYKDVVKNGLFIKEPVERMWTDGNVLLIVDVDTKKVLKLNATSCWAGRGSGFRLDYDIYDDIGTFFYVEDDDVWLFLNW